jgi:5-methylcytosine-specific restriction protein A
MAKRRTWTARRRLALFEAHKGVCHICGEKIDGTRETWEIEHVIPLAMGGADDESNCRPAHARCHRPKTSDDRKVIAKAERVRAKHMGAKPSPKAKIPGSKGTKWKRKLDGTIVPRD